MKKHFVQMVMFVLLVILPGKGVQAAAEQQADLYQEYGRGELLSGNYQQALVYLARSYSLQDATTKPDSLRFLLGQATDALFPLYYDTGWRDVLSVREMMLPLGSRRIYGNRIIVDSVTATEKRVVDGISHRVLAVLPGKSEAGWAMGHTRKISSAVFSPDGKYILTTGMDCMFIVWDANSGEPVAQQYNWIEPEKVSKRYQDVAGSPVMLGIFTPDGKYVLTVDQVGIIRRWDANTLALVSMVYDGSASLDVHRWQAHPHHAVYCENQSAQFVAVADDNEVSVWDFATGKRIAYMDGHAAQGLAFSGDCGLLALAGLHKVHVVRVDLLREETRRRYQCIENKLDLEEFTKEQCRSAAQYDLASMVLKINIETGPWHVIEADVHDQEIDGIMWGRQGETVFLHTETGGWGGLDPDSGRLMIYATKEQLMTDMPGVQEKLPGRFASLSPEDTNRNGETLTSMNLTGILPLSSGSFSPDGKKLVTINTAKPRQLEIRDALTLRLLQRLQVDAPLERAVFAPRGRYIATFDEKDHFLLVDTDSGKTVFSRQLEKAPVGMLFPGQGAYCLVLLASAVPPLIVNTQTLAPEQWSVTDILPKIDREDWQWALEDDLTTIAGRPEALDDDLPSVAGDISISEGSDAFLYLSKDIPGSPDMIYVYSVSAKDKKIVLAETIVVPDKNGRMLADSAMFAPGIGNIFMAGTKKGQIWFWKIRNKGDEPFKVIENNNPAARSVAITRFSADGSMVVSTDSDHIAKVWDVQSGAMLCAHGIPDDPVTDIAFSPAGDLLAVLHHQSGLVYVIDPNNGRTLQTFSVSLSDKAKLVFSPHGARLAVTSRKNTFFLPVSLEQRSAARIKRMIKCSVPWKLENDGIRPVKPDSSSCVSLRSP